MPKISVIIPIYNAEPYLEETLTSLMCQTFSDFEIICIMDCPKDKSLQIVQKYQKKDDRIKVIENKCNIGAAQSRNRGIEMALAPYLSFLDADDVFEKDMLEIAYEAIDSESADIAIYDYDTFSSAVFGDISKPDKTDVLKRVFRLTDLPEAGLTFWNCVPWNKMYRKEFVLQNELQYQSLPSSNDVYFSDMSMILAGKIVYAHTDRKLLHHRINTTTQISANRNPKCAWEAMKKVYLALQEKEIWESNKSYYYIKFINTIISDFRRCRNKEFVKNTYDIIHEIGGYEIGLDKVKETDFCNPYYAAELRKFVEKPYESNWFAYAITLHVRLWYDKKNIEKLFEELENTHRKIALWGAGPGGMSVLRFCAELGKNIDYVIDNDKKKQGKFIRDKRVYCFEEVKDDIGIVIVPNRNYYEAIYQQVMKVKEDISVICLEDFLQEIWY